MSAAAAAAAALRPINVMLDIFLIPSVAVTYSTSYYDPKIFL